MSATTTQLLSSGEFCKLRYDTMPVKSAYANVSFYTNDRKMPNFLVATLLSQNERCVLFKELYFALPSYVASFEIGCLVSSVYFMNAG
jgi:hypothetical protein